VKTPGAVPSSYGEKYFEVYLSPSVRVLYQAEPTTPYPGFLLAPVDITYINSPFFYCASELSRDKVTYHMVPLDFLMNMGAKLVGTPVPPLACPIVNIPKDQQ